MIKWGAAIIDIGGESTRPGSKPVPAQEQINRVIPVIEQLCTETDTLISIDTMSAAVAQAALRAGAHIVNDVSALEADPEMANIINEFNAGVILMHKKGMPETMQENPNYADVVDEVNNYLINRIAFAESQGISREQIVLDPGLGFGKRQEHNLALLQGISKICESGIPILIGASRKSIVEHLTGREINDRLGGSLGIAAYTFQQGAQILRVHDVMETYDLIQTLYQLAK